MLIIWVVIFTSSVVILCQLIPKYTKLGGIHYFDSGLLLLVIEVIDLGDLKRRVFPVHFALVLQRLGI